MIGTIIAIAIISLVIGLIFWGLQSYSDAAKKGQVYVGKVIGTTEEQSGYASHTACIVLYNNQRYSVDVFGGGGCTYTIGENIPFRIMSTVHGVQVD